MLLGVLLFASMLSSTSLVTLLVRLIPRSAGGNSPSFTVLLLGGVEGLVTDTSAREPPVCKFAPKETF